MAVSTIEGHLAWYVGAGELEVNKLVSAEKVEMISQYLHEYNSSGLGFVKSKLGDQVTFSETQVCDEPFEAKRKIGDNIKLPPIKSLLTISGFWNFENLDFQSTIIFQPCLSSISPSWIPLRVL